VATNSPGKKLEGGISMCVIIVKPKGNTLAKETLDICFHNNDDGGGFMYYDPASAQVIGDKGYMTFHSFWNGLQKKGFADDKEVTAEHGMILHCRIASHGTITASMTHPFPISAHLNDLKRLNWEAECGVAHNGTISGVSDWKDKTKSDTMAFVMEYLADRTVIDMLKHPGCAKLFTFSWKSSNKFAILTNQNELILIGNFVKGQDGNLYSNSTFQAKTPKYTYGNGWNWSGSHSSQTVINGSTPKLVPAQGKPADCTVVTASCAICTFYKFYPNSASKYAHYCQHRTCYFTL